MNRKEGWTVTIHEFCEHCNSLQPDIKERTYWRYWTAAKITSCDACFKKRDEEFQNQSY